jgi:hypothetical protein
MKVKILMRLQRCLQRYNYMMLRLSVKLRHLVAQLIKCFAHQGGSINMDEDTKAVLELLKIKAYLVREYSNKRLAVHTKDMLDMVNGALNALDHERKL